VARFLATVGVAACGLITSVLTAIAVLLVEKLVGLNIFTFMLWFVVPAGAAMTGFVAASGYYFGTLYFHTRPGILLFLQMVLIAGFTQWLIYYGEYLTLVLDDGRRISDFVPFADYLEIRLTKTEYRVGRGSSSSGPVGELGYWIALLQFVGFLLGGVVCFLILRQKPVCAACQKYYRPLGSVDKKFSEQDQFVAYYDTIFSAPVDSEDFAKAIQTKREAKVEQGTINVRSSLLGCPACKEQIIDDKVQVYNGSDWKDLTDLRRMTRIPAGVNLVPLFRSKT
jgi:hypothetical protein